MTDHQHSWGILAAFRASEAAQTLELNVWHENVRFDATCSCGLVQTFEHGLVYLTKRPDPNEPATSGPFNVDELRTYTREKGDQI